MRPSSNRASSPADRSTHRRLAPAPQGRQFRPGSADADYDVVVLGGGPGRLFGLRFAAADQGLKTAIIERYDATLGGVVL